MFVADIH